MSNPTPMPTRLEVMQWLLDLRDGKVTPEQASDWATQWLIFDTVPGQDLEIDDFGAWGAITALGGADMPGSADGEHLFGPLDFSDWIDQLQVAARES
jgi:hypothetical protein